MGGICGWICAEGRPPAGARQAMLGALDHRRDVAWLDGSGESSVVIDSSFTVPGEAAAAWAACAGGELQSLPARLEGSFAVAALDRDRARLLLARDPLGEKPLYYAVTDGGVCFASELKALRAARALGDPVLCPEAVDAYLAFTYIPAPRTIFAGALKVPGGCSAVVDLRALAAGSPGAVEVHRYWRLPDRDGLEANAADMIGKLREAVSRRLPRGPSAAFLSGGLDSSIVVALAAKERGKGLPTFSIRFAEAGLDESAHARRVAALAGCDHHEILLDSVGPEVVCAVLDHLDEPMADAAAIPTFLLGREAAGPPCGARVAMTGDGADALLAGDHWFRRLRRLDRLERLPGAVRAAIPAASLLAGPRQHRRWRDLVALIELEPARRYFAIREKWALRDRMEIYAEEFRRSLDRSAAGRTYTEAPVVWRPGGSVDAAVRLDTIHGLPEDLLMKGDKMGMAHGLESRSPFMDRRFAEWAARLRIDLLVRGATSKYLLKKAAETLLPRDLVHRRKHGFQVPIGRWMKGPLRELTEAAFAPGLIGRQGIFDASALGRLKERFEADSGNPALDGRVWQIVALQTWWRRVLDR